MKLSISSDQLFAATPDAVQRYFSQQTSATATARRIEKPPGVQSRVAVVLLADRLIVPDTVNRIGIELRQAVENPEVGSIVILCDCPGGTAVASGFLAEEVAMANSMKPVHAYVWGMAASGAYRAISQASSITGSRHSSVGSIGTINVLIDSSEEAQREGRKVITISTGRFKGIGVPGVEISSEDIDSLRRFVNASNLQFLADVSRGRSINTRVVVETIATGEMWMAHEAVPLKLLDRIERYPDFLRRINSEHHVATAPPDYSDLTGLQAFQKANDLLHPASMFSASEADKRRLRTKHKRLFCEADRHLQKLEASSGHK